MREAVMIDDEVNCEDERIEKPLDLTVNLENDKISENVPIGISLDQIEQSFDGHWAYGELRCRYNALNDLIWLKDFSHVTCLDVSFNNISDLTPVECLQSLVVLNCSHNRLISVFQFKALLWLQVVDASHNQIAELPDLGKFLLLTKLNISHNRVSNLNALKSCRNLKYLHAGHNSLRDVTGAHQLPLTHVLLNDNKIEQTSSLAQLWKVQFVDISCNRVQSLRGLSNLHQLRCFICRNNSGLRDLGELHHLTYLYNLQCVDMRGCPVREARHYRTALLFHVPRVRILDGQTVSVCQRDLGVPVQEEHAFCVAAQDHADLSLLRLKSAWREHVTDPDTAECLYKQPVLMVSDEDVEQEVSRRMIAECLVVVGVPGSEQQELVKMVINGDLGHQFLPAAIYTDGPQCCTQPGNIPAPESHPGYVCVSSERFSEIKRCGGMAASYHCFNVEYGVSEESVRRARREKLVLLVETDLTAALSLQRRLSNVHLVLTVPLDENIHQRRLQQIMMVEDGPPSRAELTAQGSVSSVDSELSTVEPFSEHEVDMEDVLMSTVSESLDHQCSTEVSWTQFPRGQECSALIQDQLIGVDSSLSFSGEEEDGMRCTETDNVTKTPHNSTISLENQEQDEQSIPEMSVKKRYTDCQIKHVISLARRYRRLHNENPGLFLSAINSDQLSSAYDQLHRLITSNLFRRRSLQQQGRYAVRSQDYRTLQKSLALYLTQDPCI